VQFKSILKKHSTDSEYFFKKREIPKELQAVVPAWPFSMNAPIIAKIPPIIPKPPRTNGSIKVLTSGLARIKHPKIISRIPIIPAPHPPPLKAAKMPMNPMIRPHTPTRMIKR
jgi:hypothetical protein